MPARKVTIKDVAREAGVSISTVSNALNNVDVLAPDTKAHVLEVAARLNYVPNLNGRNLKAQATKVIGLFLSAVRGPYYGTLADSIHSACRDRGYELNIFLSDHPDRMMANILGRRVDGAIILNEFLGEEQQRRLSEERIPTVFIDRMAKDDKMSSVVFDSYREGEQAARYLLELGHKTFLHVEGVAHNFDSTERKRGFRRVLADAGIELTDECVIPGGFERELAYQSMTEYMDRHMTMPDAIFAANDLSAIGTIKALQDGGVRVPEDVSVLGCDDIEIIRMTRPTISTIRTSFEKQGERAVERLVRLIRGEEDGLIDILYGSIIPRESTMARE